MGADMGGDGGDWARSDFFGLDGLVASLMDLRNVEDDEVVSAHDHLRFAQARASYLSGVARGVNDALSLLEEPGALNELSQEMPPEQAAFPERVARAAMRRMAAYKLKHSAQADEDASLAMRSYMDAITRGPSYNRCTFCHAATKLRLKDNRDYGPAPTAAEDDSL